MNSLQRIVKNSMVMFFGHIMRRVFSLLYLIFLARYLGADQFGVFSFAFALTGLFVVFVDLGLDQLTVREVAKDKDSAAQYLGNLIMLKVLLGIFTFGLIAAYINAAGYPRQTITIVYFFGIMIVVRALTNVFYAVFQAFERMEYNSIGMVAGNILLFTGVMLGISFRYSLTRISFVFVVVSFLELLFFYMLCLRRFTRPDFHPDLAFWKKSIATAWPLGLTSIFVSIYFRIDTVMLSQIKGDTAVGLYSAAYRLSENALIIPSVFVGALFPVLSSSHKHSSRAFNQLYSLSTKWLVYMALPMAALVSLFSRPIIRFVYGGEFLDSSAALLVLIWASALMYVTIVQGSTMIAANKQKLNMKICGLTVLINIVLNVIAIPRFGYLGAAAATVLTELFGFFVTLYFLNAFGYRLDVFRTWGLPLAGFGVAGCLLLILQRMGLNTIPAAAVFTAVYCTIVFIFGIRKKDLQELAELKRTAQNPETTFSDRNRLCIGEPCE